jgi:hypothetical protein
MTVAPRPQLTIPAKRSRPRDADPVRHRLPIGGGSHGPKRLSPYERVGCTFNSCRPRSPLEVGSFVPDSVLIMRRRRRPVFLRDRKDTACGAVARPVRYFDLAAKVVGPPGRGR